MLTTNRVTYGDAGQYKCSAKNSEGKNEAAFHITVTGKCWLTYFRSVVLLIFCCSFQTFTFFELCLLLLCPGPPEINPELRNQAVTHNTSLQFKCSLSDFPTPAILWTKDGVKLGNNNTLTINRVSYGDAGQYACRANNSEGKSEAAFHITVTGKCWLTFVSFSFYSHFSDFFFHTFTFFELYFLILCPGPPEINPELTNQSVTYKTPLQLVCSLSGFPTPEILWTKDGVNLGNNNTFTINRVSYGDAGQYTCRANNSEGKSEAAFHITVTGKCWLTFVSFSFYSHFSDFFISYFHLFWIVLLNSMARSSWN